jgi:hypothetical protein
VLANIKNRNKMKKLLTITLLLLTLIACQDDSRVDNLHREIEEPIKEEKQTRLEEKFPANTYAVATQKRVYFHSKPDKASKLELFIISGQFCTIEKVKNDFGYVSFVYKNKTTRGWLNLKHLEPSGPLVEDTNKPSDLQFRLILFNESESPINPEKTIADYKIEIRDGNNVITFFESENAASAFLTDDKDVVYIYPDSGAHYTYTFDKKKDDEVVIFLNFFYPDLDREVWSKTYKKDRNNNWKLVSCDGDCD